MDRFVLLIFFCIISVLWIAGIFRILTSDNIRLVKLILFLASFFIPFFPILYLFKKHIAKEIKGAPNRIATATSTSTKITGKAVSTAADFLLKK